MGGGGRWLTGFFLSFSDCGLTLMKGGSPCSLLLTVVKGLDKNEGMKSFVFFLTYVSIHLFIYLHLCVCVCACVCVYVRAFVYVCVRAFAYV